MALPFKEPGDPEDIKGSKNPTEQPDSYVFVKGQGWTTVKSWESPTKGGAFGIAQDLVNALYTNVRVDQVRPGVWRVEGSIQGQGDGSAQEVVDNRELFATMQQSEIMTHPTAVAFPENVIKSIIKTTDSPDEGVSPALTDTSETGDQMKFYKLRLSGVKSYLKPEFILRITRTVSSDDQIEGALSMEGVGQIWTMDELPFLDDILEGAIETIENPGTPTGYVFGWLKMAPTLHTDVYGRAQIQLEWWLSNWPTVLYSEF